MGFSLGTLGAAVGTGVGAFIPGGAAIGGGLGAMLGGGLDSANAAGKSAAEMAAEADSWKRYVKSQQDKALANVNTPTQMAAYDQALHAQEANVKRQQALVASLDPNLIEAGKQTTQLLQGHSAPVLGQIQNQRALQRTQMMDNLRQQLGSGAETSSAGIQAMQKFDMDTANIMNSTQQEYLDKVSNMSLGGAATLGDSLSKVSSTLSGMQTQSPGAQAADIMAKFTGAMGGAEQASMEAAGGKYAKDQIQGQTIAGLGGAALTLGAAQLGNKSLNPTQPQQPGAGLAGGQTSADYNPNDANWKAYSAANQQPQNTLAGAVAPPAAPGMQRSPGVGIPNAPTYLPFSSGYGGKGTAENYSMNPSAVPYQPYQFNPSSYGGRTAGGGY